jgi:hypothetical protein
MEHTPQHANAEGVAVTNHSLCRRSKNEILYVTIKPQKRYYCNKQNPDF